MLHFGSEQVFSTTHGLILMLHSISPSPGHDALSSWRLLCGTCSHQEEPRHLMSHFSPSSQVDGPGKQSHLDGEGATMDEMSLPQHTNTAGVIPLSSCTCLDGPWCEQSLSASSLPLRSQWSTMG